MQSWECVSVECVVWEPRTTVADAAGQPGGPPTAPLLLRIEGRALYFAYVLLKYSRSLTCRADLVIDNFSRVFPLYLFSDR
ncbi:hypothetical protein Trydic_g23772 [Trypoxylus dichotomus]